MARLLRERDVTSLLTMQEALTAVEDAFRSLAIGAAVNMPRQRAALPGITMNVLCAVSTALDATAVKCYPVVRRDIAVGSSFTVLVYRISTGALIGILEADKLGQMRTGAASGIATKYMARPDSRVVTLFGAGWQARSQLEAVSRVLPRLERVNVVGRSPDRVQRLCAEMRKQLNLDIVPATDAKRAVVEADVIITVTGSSTPVFDGSWLQPGVHINAAGSNFAEKKELDSTAVARADRIAVDDIAVARIESGDLLAATADGQLDWQTVQPLAGIVAGAMPGRAADKDITLFESHGIGLEDLAVALRALELAQRQDAGTEIDLR